MVPGRFSGKLLEDCQSSGDGLELIGGTLTFGITLFNIIYLAVLHYCRIFVSTIKTMDIMHKKFTIELINQSITNRKSGDLNFIFNVTKDNFTRLNLYYTMSFI